MFEFTYQDEDFMRRCYTIASYGLGKVRTNPMVGSVVVANDKIIGEGYHEYFGGLHGERNALLNVSSDNDHLLSKATLYITLEPCNHHGKTPPCTDIIVKKGIKKVIVSQLDPNPKMQGKSIEYLRSKGIQVKTGLLEKHGKYFNRAFITNQKYNVPYTILKYAISKNGYMGKDNEQIWLSSKESQLLVHKWRSEIDGIMIGTQTAIIDNPKLNNRLYPGPSPLRIVIDRNERIPKSHYLFSLNQPTLIYSSKPNYSTISHHVELSILPESVEIQLKWIFKDLYQRGIGTLMVEGGRQLLISIIKEGLWHEAKIIKTNRELTNGLKAPKIKGKIRDQMELNTDKILTINSLEFEDSLF